MSKPEVGTPEYDQQMIELAESTEAGQQTDEAVLEAELQNTPEEKPEETSKEDFELPDGVSMDDLLAAYKAQQEGSTEESSDNEEQQEEPAESDDEVSQLKAQLKQLQDNLVVEQIHSAAGGKEQFEALKASAEQELDETQRNMLNAALVDGTQEQAVAAVKLMQRLLDSNPSSPSREGNFVSDNQPSVSNTGYSSESEMVDAMSDPRYARQDGVGAKYRAEVAAKLQRSTF